MGKYGRMGIVTTLRTESQLVREQDYKGATIAHLSPFVFFHVYLVLLHYFHAKDESQDIIHALDYTIVSQKTTFYMWCWIWSGRFNFRYFW